MFNHSVHTCHGAEHEPIYGYKAQLPKKSHLNNETVIAALFHDKLKTSVKKLLTNNQKVALMYKKIVELHLFSSEYDPLVGKSVESFDVCFASAQITGHEPDLNRALACYTKCVTLAPFPIVTSLPSELARAFACRAGIYFLLDEFENCLHDVDNALTLNCTLDKKTNLFAMKGNVLCLLGRCDEAVLYLQAAIEYLKYDSFHDTQEKKDIFKANLTEHIKEMVEGRTPNEKLLLRTVRKPPQVASKANPEIPSASNCVKISFDKFWERHLLADRDIQPGEVLIVEESHIASLDETLDLCHCHFCFKNTSCLIPCMYCQWVLYCSEECRTKSWFHSHEIMCDVLDFLKPVIHDPSIIAAAQQLVVATKRFGGMRGLCDYIKQQSTTSTDPCYKGFNEQGQFLSSDYTTVHAMERHEDKYTNEEKFLFALKSALLLNCIERVEYFKQDMTRKCLKRFAGGLLLQFIMSNEINMDTVTCTVLQGEHTYNAGYALYPTLKLLNHSCDPNVFKVYLGNVVIVVAAVPIAKGSQLFINYLESPAPHSTTCDLCNQKLYNFKCTCKFCVNKISKPSTIFPAVQLAGMWR